MKNKRILVAAALVGILVVATVLRFGIAGKGTLDTLETGKDSASSQSSESPQEPAVPDPVTLDLISVGDNLIHSSIYQQAKERAGGNGYDFSFAYENIVQTVKQADVATINQETVLSADDPPATYPLFNSPRELGEHMIDMGFDVFSLANNHMLDKKESGLISTLEYWNSKLPQVAHTGAYLNQQEMEKPETFEKDGIIFGLVGATQYTNGLKLPQGSELGYILTSEENLLKQKIETTAAVSDFVIVNVHWGAEYSTTQNAVQKQLAQKMADWGADIIIGHHPHVLQPMEYLTKADGSKAFVAYSLGNFISAQDKSPRLIGGMLHYSVTKNFETGETTLGEVWMEPVITHYESRFKNLKLYKRSQYTDVLAAAHGVKSKSNFDLQAIDQFVSEIVDAQFLKQ